MPAPHNWWAEEDLLSLNRGVQIWPSRSYLPRVFDLIRLQQQNMVRLGRPQPSHYRRLWRQPDRRTGS